MTVRKNQATLTADEKRRFVDALIELKRSGRYDTFVTTHNEFIMSDTDFGDRVGHRSPSFLPWHRRFLLQFEQALQSIDSSVTLPYWDWTADRTARSSLWAADFLGGTGRSRDSRVMDGPFAFGSGNWPIRVRVDGRGYLRRSLGAGGGLTLPTRAEVDSVLAMPTYDTAPWNSSSDGFRNHLEGWRGVNLHNRVHVWVGGQMATGVSPNDPVFWLHHAFVDKLWADWQALHPDSSYLPRGGTRNVVDLDDTMRPWNDVTPADMLDHTAFYTFDTAA
ncbi:tyrosinase family protein [Streptomyces sp. HNM0663]|uniref:Tyrosinase family protein n=1 Tax=Streptomyces chengmaiensis TaxID=3040919 RepID=A0ABT6HJQ5_9ACTN|nr:tyrosinase family protein [Streptomyces chengmaiensis]MDH2388835.1 tyrosinase family protein [Streptomyces chengmaiensis]